MSKDDSMASKISKYLTLWLFCTLIFFEAVLATSSNEVGHLEISVCDGEISGFWLIRNFVVGESRDPDPNTDGPREFVQNNTPDGDLVIQAQKISFETKDFRRLGGYLVPAILAHKEKPRGFGKATLVRD